MSQKWYRFGFVALVLAAVGLDSLQRGNLADPLPFAITLLAALGGGTLGYLGAVAAINANTTEKRYRKFIVLVSFPLFGLLTGPMVMRSLVLQAAFAGVKTAPKVASLYIEDADRQRKRTFSDTTYHYTVSLPDGRRSFRIHVDRALYEKVGPKKPPAMEHCIHLPVEKGRWGIRRVLAPNYFDAPLGVQRYHSCKGRL